MLTREAETGGTPRMDGRWLPEAGRGKGGLYPESQREQGLANTLIVDSWSPGQWENKFVVWRLTAHSPLSQQPYKTSTEPFPKEHNEINIYQTCIHINTEQKDNNVRCEISFVNIFCRQCLAVKKYSSHFWVFLSPYHCGSALVILFLNMLLCTQQSWTNIYWGKYSSTPPSANGCFLGTKLTHIDLGKTWPKLQTQMPHPKIKYKLLLFRLFVHRIYQHKYSYALYITFQQQKMCELL